MAYKKKLPQDVDNQELANKINPKLSQLRLDFLIRQDDILNRHLSHDDERREIEKLLSEYNDEVKEIFKGTGKTIGIFHRIPKLHDKYNYQLELGPSYTFVLNNSQVGTMQRCKNCAMWFYKDRENQIYCQKHCQNDARRKKASLRVKQNRLKKRMTILGNSLLYEKLCEVCGKTFRSKRSVANTCSDSCRMKKSRLKKTLTKFYETPA